MRLRMELEQEDDGRWIAEIPELPGVLVFTGRRVKRRFERCRRWLFE
jgi:hypothetical protein